MKVCYFGSYNSEYARNRILMKGLKQNGISIFECQDNSFILIRYIKLLWKYFHLKKHDIIIVGAMDRTSVPLAYILAKIFRRKLIIDPFISYYDTSVVDRKTIKENSIRSIIPRIYDKYPAYFSDLILAITKEYAEYFYKEFGINKNKLRTIYLGADSDIFYPKDCNNTNKQTLRVSFHGSFIPLQGVQYIIEAAKILENEDIHFDLIGSGQTYDECIQLSRELKIKNVKFHGWKDYEEIVNYLGKADICLGIFGDTDKAKRVVTNKVYEAIAMKKAVITGYSNGSTEVLTNLKNALLCEMGNPAALAEAILLLKNDVELREKIARGGYQLFQSRFTPQKLGAELKDVLEECIASKAK